MTFRWENDNAVFSFVINSEKGGMIPYREWDKYESEFLSQLSVVQELVDNGKGRISEFSVDIEIEDLLNLEEIDRILLGLPDVYPFMLYIESEGFLNQSHFKVKYSFYDFVPNGNNLFLKREGCILKDEGSEYLLSLNQYKVLEIIDQYNALSDANKTYQKNLTTFAEIKRLSKEVPILLDSYLENEDIVHPDKIKIDVSYEDGILELRPEIDNVSKEELQKKFDLFSTAKPIYNTDDPQGKRVRVVLDNSQKNELKKIKQKRFIHDHIIIEDITEHPEKYFDDEIIDLVNFSKRVKEVGAYKPKFYPFVCPYKSKWIPGFIVKDRVEGHEKIPFKTHNDLNEFIKERDWAREKGESHFKYNDQDVAVKDANKIISVAKKQFENPEKPIQTEKKEREEKILIIKENADVLEYIEVAEASKTIYYDFSNVENLAYPFQLKKHQVEGTAWLQTLFNKNLPGCLLADDMGLGKTLQLLYFIEWHVQNYNSNKPYLIVAPVSLLENWEREYKQFFNPVNLTVLRAREAGIPRKFSRSAVEKLQQKQLILTNYESLRSYQLNLCAVDYAIVVLDEAQRIKNPGTLVTNAAKALKADFKVPMTGTPVENTLIDLWCIMDFAVPGLLGTAKKFAEIYQNPLKDEDTDVSALGENLRGEIGDFLKRRLKKDVAQDLPAKNIMSLLREMPPIQFDRYLLEIKLSKEEDLEGVERRNKILRSIGNIRDISDHPYIVDNQIDMYDSDRLIVSSAKLQCVVEILHKIERKAEKVIIFADRKATQRMLKKVITDKFNIPAKKISIINGDTPTTSRKRSSSTKSRQQAIDDFQEKNGFNVIIMSPLAAGVGLNVVGANHVIHYSRHWNPAKEDQATDRVYRIGQTKDVTVYYPMAVFPEDYVAENGKRNKSFDEVLDELLSRKRKLASSTLFPTDRSEVDWNVIYSDVFKKKKPANIKETSLTIEEIEKLQPKLFEAFVAALYAKQGFKIRLTPFSNDKGADVIAFSSGENYLIQAKKSQSKLNNKSVQEIVTAKNYYTNSFSEKFKLMVLTNNYFGNSASTLGKSNNVLLIDGSELKRMIQKFPVSITDVHRYEGLRLQKI